MRRAVSPCAGRTASWTRNPSIPQAHVPLASVSRSFMFQLDRKVMDAQAMSLALSRTATFPFQEPDMIMFPHADRLGFRETRSLSVRLPAGLGASGARFLIVCGTMRIARPEPSVTGRTSPLATASRVIR